MAPAVQVKFDLIASSADLTLKAAEARTALTRLGGQAETATMSQHRLYNSSAKVSMGLSHLAGSLGGLHSGVGTAISGMLHLTDVFIMFQSAGMLAFGGVMAGATGLGLALSAIHDWGMKNIADGEKIIEQS